MLEESRIRQVHLPLPAINAYEIIFELSHSRSSVGSALAPPHGDDVAIGCQAPAISTHEPASNFTFPKVRPPCFLSHLNPSEARIFYDT